jgi:hypothetical protein
MQLKSLTQFVKIIIFDVRPEKIMDDFAIDHNPSHRIIPLEVFRIILDILKNTQPRIVHQFERPTMGYKKVAFFLIFSLRKFFKLRLL